MALGSIKGPKDILRPWYAIRSHLMTFYLLPHFEDSSCNHVCHYDALMMLKFLIISQCYFFAFSCCFVLLVYLFVLFWNLFIPYSYSFFSLSLRHRAYSFVLENASISKISWSFIIIISLYSQNWLYHQYQYEYHYHNH